MPSITHDKKEEKQDETGSKNTLKPSTSQRKGVKGLGFKDGASALSPRDKIPDWEVIRSGKRVLKRGDKGPLVKILQGQLRLMGFDLVVDGVFGAKTQKAVMDFQQSHNLVVDGIVGEKTINALEKSIGVEPVGRMHGDSQATILGEDTGDWNAVLGGARKIKEGDKGALVETLQNKLNQANLTCSVDGVFGGKTLARVMELQTKVGLIADGVVGKQTAEALDREIEWQKVVKGTMRLEEGSQGPAVYRLQQILTAVGFGVAKTSQFGQTTKAQVESFQRSYKIQVTGKVGPTTAKALEEAVSGGNLGPVVMIEGYQDGKSLGMIACVMVDNKPVEKRTASAFLRMREAAKKDGAHIYVVSGMRTYQEQQYLYNLYLRGVGNPAYKPGYSDHQNGIALDLGGDLWWLTKNAWRFGFVMPYSHEPWHWEYRP